MRGAQKSQILTLSAVLTAGALTLGPIACGGSQHGSAEASYEEHLEAAEREESRADSAASQAERDATEIEGRQVDYQGYREQAEQHRLHAEEHRLEAASLVEQEQDECAAAPETSRDACPLQAPYRVADAREVQGGVRIVLDTDRMEVLRSTVDCHSAHAAFLGYEGMSHCVFYLPGIDVAVEATPEGMTALTITADDEETIEAIRNRTVRAWTPFDFETIDPPIY